MGAQLGESFYNVNVTPEELWLELGKTLAKYSFERDWGPVDVQRHGGPSYKTVQAIDKGRIGNVESLEKYAQALGMSIVDILHAILTAKETPLSPEASRLVRAFRETTVDGRLALLAMANALPREPKPPTAAPPTAAAAPATPRPPRSGPREVKPRSTR